MTFLRVFYFVILSCALLLGIFRYKIFSKELKIIFLFVVFSCLTEAFSPIYKALIMKNTMPIGNIYIPVSIFILGLFYLQLLKGFINRKIIIAVIIAFELLCIINLVFIQNILEFPNIIGSVGALIVIVLSLLLFSRIMVEAEIEKLAKHPIIWINTSILIYYAANFFFYILLNYNVKFDNAFAIQTVIVYRWINVLFYLLIAIGFWKAKMSRNA